MTQYWFAASTEEFPPSEMIEQARAAERGGLRRPRAPPTISRPGSPTARRSQAWVVLGALGQVTTKPIGTGVTPVVHHYHPGLVAQAFMSLEELYPAACSSAPAPARRSTSRRWASTGRRFAEQRERFEAGLEAITRLWDGETVTMDAGWFALKEAKLWTRAPTPPRLYVSAFGPQAAQVAGQVRRRAVDARRPRGRARDHRRLPRVLRAPRARGGRDHLAGRLRVGRGRGRRSAARASGSRRSCPSSTSRTSPTRTTCSAAPTSR